MAVRRARAACLVCGVHDVVGLVVVGSRADAERRAPLDNSHQLGVTVMPCKALHALRAVCAACRVRCVPCALRAMHSRAVSGTHVWHLRARRGSGWVAYRCCKNAKQVRQILPLRKELRALRMTFGGSLGVPCFLFCGPFDDFVLYVIGVDDFMEFRPDNKQEELCNTRVPWSADDYPGWLDLNRVRARRHPRSDV